jgi:hypothetical protein
MGLFEVFLVIIITGYGIVLAHMMLRPVWWPIQDKVGNWWKTRNKTLKDYDIERTLIVPIMHGLLEFEGVSKIEWTGYRRENLDRKLAVVQTSEKLSQLIKRRFRLSEQVYKRAVELEPQLERLEYVYGVEKPPTTPFDKEHYDSCSRCQKYLGDYVRMQDK